MHILIAVGSRHGSTREIAGCIAKELEGAGHTTVIHNVREKVEVGSYDAAVIGSAVYMGKWLAEARDFVQRNQAILTTVPVWLFSSGPLTANDLPKSDPAHLAELMGESGAREHRNFVGRIDRNDLGRGEKLVMTMVRPPEGDFRDWDSIREWAHEIAIGLAANPVGAGAPT